MKNKHAGVTIHRPECLNGDTTQIEVQMVSFIVTWAIPKQNEPGRFASDWKKEKECEAKWRNLLLFLIYSLNIK